MIRSVSGVGLWVREAIVLNGGFIIPFADLTWVVVIPLVLYMRIFRYSYIIKSIS